MKPGTTPAVLHRIPDATVRLDGDAPVLLNIGWLDAERDCQRGPTAPELVTHLLRMAARYTVATRGIHWCPFCKTRITMTADGKDVHGAWALHVYRPASRLPGRKIGGSLPRFAESASSRRSRWRTR